MGALDKGCWGGGYAIDAISFSCGAADFIVFEIFEKVFVLWGVYFEEFGFDAY